MNGRIRPVAAVPETIGLMEKKGEIYECYLCKILFFFCISTLTSVFLFSFNYIKRPEILFFLSLLFFFGAACTYIDKFLRHLTQKKSMKTAPVNF